MAVAWFFTPFFITQKIPLPFNLTLDILLAGLRRNEKRPPEHPGLGMLWGPPICCLVVAASHSPLRAQRGGVALLPEAGCRCPPAGPHGADTGLVHVHRLAHVQHSDDCVQDELPLGDLPAQAGALSLQVRLDPLKKFFIDKALIMLLPPTIERQSKHNHQCEQGERKKPSIGLPENWQAVDGLFVVLSAGEFESCVSSKNSQIRRICISGALFYAP